jgi:hypothetical protein
MNKYLKYKLFKYLMPYYVKTNTNVGQSQLLYNPANRITIYDTNTLLRIKPQK